MKDNPFNFEYKPNIMQSLTEELNDQVVKHTENLLLEQLNDFVSRGLIIAEKGPMTMVRDPSNDKIVINQSINLVLKDKEYIESLEKQVKELSENLQKIKDTLK